MPVFAEPDAQDPYAAWTAAPRRRRGKGRVALTLFVPLFVFAFLTIGFIAYNMFLDPASAAGGCGGG
jgi:hypothetical protein